MKGKVERPYSFIREGFWRGYGFVCLETANRDLPAWLEKKEKRIHGTTHEVVCLRFAREAHHLNPLPRQAFDTSYRIYRKVAESSGLGLLLHRNNHFCLFILKEQFIIHELAFQ